MTLRTSSEIERLEHPSLGGDGGTPLTEAALSDRARLGVTLQAAGLLSLCEVAGFRLAGQLADGRVDNSGRLVGLMAERGAGADCAPHLLAGLLRALFGSDKVAGRGEGRRAARALLERWDGALDRPSADRALADLFEAAPFLDEDEFDGARAALRGATVVGGERRSWQAGPSARESQAIAESRSLAELVAARRWRAAVALGRARAPVDAAERLAFARALYALGKSDGALGALGTDGGAAAETLRAEALLALAELGAARETVRRLETSELSARELLDAGDAALRVLALCGEGDAARDWCARAVARARGEERVEAQLLAALAALDRGESELARARFEELRAAGAALDASRAALAREVELQLALAAGDGESASRLAGERLRTERRTLGLVAAGRLWSNLGSARSLGRDFVGAERAYGHAARLLRRCDGPLWLTLAAANLADVRLRLGKLRDVQSILERSAAWNRRAGNARGLVEDELISVRLDLVRGELEHAVARCRRERERQEASGERWANERLAALEARALGWLARPEEAKRALVGMGEIGASELEPEELPFLFALAGDTERALAAVEGSGVASLAAPLLRGESPVATRWRVLNRLEPFRRARFVLDAELLLPGSTPHELRSAAASTFRRLGAASWAERCDRADVVAWRALGRYFERPVGDRAAIEELFVTVGHAEAEVVARLADGERRLAGAGGRELPEERSAAWGGGELVLRAAAIDEPLRALYALLLRDLPAPTAGAEATEDSPFTGESAALRSAVERLRRFAASELPVLILGENGTGKELAAAEIHRASARRKGPWVPLNCAGLSETLLLSELFGHARGAFTGAERERAGVFETGRGGTVFLDEIGDLPLPAQGSFLRVLQEKEIRRLGESLPRKVDARIVAATNRDLAAMVEQGKFRQDLFFRLKVATVTLPPLRERSGDVLVLAERFLEALRRHRPELKLTPDARRALTAHTWPGNVRELKHALEAAAALSDDGRIGAEQLEFEHAAPSGGEGDYHLQVEEFRKRLVERALAASDGSLAGAARQLGVSRQFLSQFVRQHGLEIRK